jgi:hypothetical protein
MIEEQGRHGGEKSRSHTVPGRIRDPEKTGTVIHGSPAVDIASDLNQGPVNPLDLPASKRGLCRIHDALLGRPGDSKIRLLRLAPRRHLGVLGL